MFANRTEAGRILADRLAHLAGDSPAVFALPRGGLPVAEPIAASLGAPLDIILVRKIGAPQQPELAVGAMVDGEEPTTILNDSILRQLRLPQGALDRAVGKAREEIRRRRLAYGDRSPVSAADRVAVIVDDGIATGASVEAAVKALRKSGARRIVVAVPVAPPDTLRRLSRIADEVVSLLTPENFHSVGAYYGDFSQLTDADVLAILDRHRTDGKPRDSGQAG